MLEELEVAKAAVERAEAAKAAGESSFIVWMLTQEAKGALVVAEAAMIAKAGV